MGADQVGRPDRAARPIVRTGIRRQAAGATDRRQQGRHALRAAPNPMAFPEPPFHQATG